MARALERSDFDPTYLEFFGLQRPPFTRLTCPTELFDAEQYSLLTAHLSAATEQSDCLVVVCGADGSGKTTQLNRYVAGLGDDICFARIDESFNNEKQFYCSFLKQLGFGEITGKPDELRRITREFLINRGMASDPVLLMVDNAHLLHPNVLEQLRWLAAIKVDEVRVLSSVLAGNSDLVRVMDSPAMSQLAFGSRRHFYIRSYTQEETANYVWHRLRLAGGVDAVSFSDEAHPLIHRYTGGVPRLINILCNAVLEEAHARQSRVITDELLRSVADKRQFIPHVVPYKGKGRRNTDPDFGRVEKLESIPDRPSTSTVSATNGSKSSAPPQDVDVDKLLSQITGLSEQVGEFRVDRKRALKEIGARDKIIGDLRKQLDAQSEEAEILARTIGHKITEIEDLNQTASVNASALHESEDVAIKLSAEQQETIKILADAEEEKSGLLCQLSDAMEAISGLEDKLERTESRLVDIAALDKTTADLKEELEKSEENCKSLQSETDSLEARNHELESQLADRADSERILVLESELHEATSELTETQTQLAETMNLKDEIQKDCKSLRSAADSLNARNEELESCLADQADAEHTLALESELQETNSKLADTQAQLAETADLKEEIQKNTADMQAVRRELDTKDAAVNDLDALLEESRKECESLHSEADSLEAQNEALQSRLANQADSERVLVLESELQEANSKLAESQAQLAETADLIANPTTDVEDSPDLDSQTAERIAAVAADLRTAAIMTFEIIKDGKTERIIEVPKDQQRLMIGRGEDNDLFLDSGFVSRHHALIQYTDDLPYIEDLNSTNGTIVNSVTITQCDLQVGDIVTIGDYQILPGPA